MPLTASTLQPGSIIRTPRATYRILARFTFTVRGTSHDVYHVARGLNPNAGGTWVNAARVQHILSAAKYVDSPIS